MVDHNSIVNNISTAEKQQLLLALSVLGSFWAKWYSSCILHSHIFQRLLVEANFLLDLLHALFAHCAETLVHGNHLCASVPLET